MPLLKTYIVEDSALIRDNLVAALQELAPVEVVGHAGDEAGALHWLAAPGHGVDLVIVDLFLLGGSGLGVLRGAHALPGVGRLAVLSNYATEDIRQRCLALGADRVFDKSTEIDALIAYCVALADRQGPATARLNG
ncbi:MAG: response regulator [Rubrivivax sp.]|nr:response regulator [Rubrivivax sp.]